MVTQLNTRDSKMSAWLRLAVEDSLVSKSKRLALPRERFVGQGPGGLCV